jgi:hypothetical protein
MWFWFFLASLTLNFGAIYYVRWLIKSLEVINEDVQLMNIIIAEFKKHLESIYELEMFYGDETLKTLLEHSKKLSDQLDGLDLVINEREEQDLAEEA